MLKSFKNESTLVSAYEILSSNLVFAPKAGTTRMVIQK